MRCFDKIQINSKVYVYLDSGGNFICSKDCQYCVVGMKIHIFHIISITNKFTITIKNKNEKYSRLYYKSDIKGGALYKIIL
jgi:hypothetical protein